MKKLRSLFILTIFSTCIFAQVPAYVPTNGLVGWWPFTGNANDISGNGNNGTVNGATLISDRFSNANSAYSFDGVSNFIQLPNDSSIAPPNISVSCWFKIISQSPNQKLIQLRLYGYSISYNFTFQFGPPALNKLATNFYIIDSLNTYLSNYANPFANNINDNNWHNIIFTFDGLTYKVFIDGNQVFSSNTFGSGSMYYNNAGNGYSIGRDGDVNGNYYGGLFDDLAIWNRALTDCEINQVYTSGSFSITTLTTSANICVGASTTITANGATTYAWMPGNLTGATVTVSPITTTTYTVIGTDANGCISTATTTVTVNPLPTVTATSSAASVCTGGSVTLNGGGATTYTWDNNVMDAVSFVPSATTTYMVTGTDVNGCSNTATTTVTVNQIPVVTASSTAAVVCAGASVTLTGSGATTYAWMPGNLTGATVVVSPSSTTAYMVTGTDANGCVNTSTTTVTVNPLPILTLLASSQIYCVSDPAGSFSASPTGGVWTGPGVTGNSFDPSVSGFGLHTVVYTYTDNNSCTNTASLLMTVNACVGINEIANGNLFSVYPNPATNEINVKANASLLGAAYTVFDNVGKVVLTGKIISENTIIELGNLSSGVYMLNIGDNLIQTFKVIKE